MRATSVLCSLIVLALTGCGADASLPPEPASELAGVDSAQAQASGWIETSLTADHLAPSRVDAPGRLLVRADADVRMSVPTSGRIREVVVREGTHVEAGAPLVVFDSAEAAEARAAVTTLDVELRAAQAELERQDRLVASGVGLAVERIQAEASLRRFEAAMGAARSTASLYGPGSGGTVTMRAPMAGVVIDVAARPGLVVSSDTGPLVSVARTDALHVRLDVYEDELHRVQIGQRVSVTPADGSRNAHGSVVEVASAADPSARRGPVLVELDEVPPGWVAGRMVRGRIDAAPMAALVVPVQAVVIRPDRSRVVYVEQDGQLLQRRVDVGRVVDGLVPVLSGLDADERIVIQGALLVDAMADRLL